MAQKPPDFKTSGLRAERIIASGSSANPRLLLIGSGAAGNDGINVDTSSLILAGTGSDTWLFISGSSGGNDRVTFGGDVYISGTLFGVSSTTPGLPANSVQFNSAGSFAGSSNFRFISNNLLVTGSNQTKGQLYVSGTAGFTGSVEIYDASGDTPQLRLSSSTGRADHSYSSDGNYYVSISKPSGEYWLSVTAPNGIGSNVLRVYPRNSGQSVTLFSSGNLVNSIARDPVTSGDTNFYVEGVPNSRGTSSTRGTAVFGGDLVSSGTIAARVGLTGSLTKLYDGTSYLIAGSNVTITTGSNGSVTIASTGGVGGGSSYFTDPVSGKINATGSLALAGGLGSSYTTANAGSDIHFFVSGTKGTIAARPSSGVSLFGGDVVTSGSLILDNGTGYGVLNMSTSGELSLRNRYQGGYFISSVYTTLGNAVNFLEVRPNGQATGSVASIFPGLYAGPANPFNSNDTTFFVSGKRGAKNGITRGASVFGGDIVASGSAYLGTDSTDSIVVNSLLASDIIPDGNRTRNLGSDTARFANIFTGDLHLRNERGDYTLIEEEDCLTVRFNKNGKRYRFVLERAPEFDEIK
jgi:hypothetical protein